MESDLNINNMKKYLIIYTDNIKIYNCVLYVSSKFMAYQRFEHDFNHSKDYTIINIIEL